MRITIDCRFIGNSGIGTFIDGVVRNLIKYHPELNYVLIVSDYLDEYNGCANISQIITDIKPFTLKELFCFPVTIVR